MENLIHFLAIGFYTTGIVYHLIAVVLLLRKEKQR